MYGLGMGHGAWMRNRNRALLENCDDVTEIQANSICLEFGSFRMGYFANSSIWGRVDGN